MKATLLPIFILAILISGCRDIPVQDQSGELINIESFTVTPQNISFTFDDGIKDSTIVLTLNAGYRLLPNTAPDNLRFGYILRNTVNNVIITEGSFPITLGDNTVDVELPLTVRTFDSREIGLTAFFTDGSSLLSNIAIGTLTINGFQVGLPEILSVENPDTVRIPAEGQPAVSFRLKATVSHPQDSELINQVLVDIRDQNNNFLAGSPFRLFDDGGLDNIPGGGTSGDEVAGDSVYTRLFQIASGNNPDVYTLFFHATDNFGASSDTVQTTMRFIR